MILYSRTLEVSEGRAVPQRLFSLGPCPLQASKHAPPARVRELAPTTGIAQGGPPWMRVGDVKSMEVAPLSASLFR